jgi:hypothetical protein
MIRRAGIVLGLVLVGSWTIAAQTPTQRQRVFAQLPDWTGVWMVDDEMWSDVGLRNGGAHDAAKALLLIKGLPLSAEGAKFLQGATAKGIPKECAFYFPFVMESPWPFEVVSTPEQTLFIFAGREIRHVYTDGRGHLPKDELWPTPWGDSVGHWEGDTLVVETIEVDPQFLPTSGARFTEKIRKVGKDRLEDTLTFINPTALTRPFTVTLPYKRLTSVDRLVHGDCMQNDRNPLVNGKDSVAPPASH